MATQRLAGLLGATHEVRRVDTSPEASEHVQADVRFSFDKVRHYVGLRRQIRQALQAAPAAPVLWASISPSPLGHLRDALTVLPGFQPDQRIYAVVHWGTFDRVFRRRLTAPTARRMVRRVHRFVFLNDQLAARCAAWIPDAQRVIIPNTIDDAVLCTDDEVRARQARRTDRLRLLFLSNMIASKGYLDVLDAVGLLHARGLRLHADFVGRWTSDADRTAFEQRVEATGVRGVVTHHGGLSDRARIKALYLDADVFLLPSYYPTEAQPLTIIEALNAGTPVVVTRHSGIPDMVREHQDALFVPPKAPVAIAEAVQRLADYDTWKQFSQQARHQFQRRFSPDAVRRQWVDLIGKREAPTGKRGNAT
jgi:glycosyltransferase involved in cell wall biosynthesis